MKRILSFILMIALVTSAAWYYAQPSPPPIPEFEPVEKIAAPDHVQKTVDWYDQYLTKVVNAEAAPGAAIAFVKDGEVLLEKGYGFRNTALKQPVDEYTVFRLASLSKGFAGILAGQLVEEKILHWDERIKNHIPAGALPNNTFTNNITIGHVLSNTSGFPHHTYSNLLNAGVSFEEIVPLLNKVKLHAAPGNYYAYQNVIFNLVTPVIEQKVKSSYELLMRKKVFDPIGMHRASVGYNNIEALINVALPHVWAESGWHPRDSRSNFYEVPAAAGVNASIHDMSQWLLSLLGHKPEALSRKVRKEVFTPVIQTDKVRYRSWKKLKKAFYGMGWRTFHYGDAEIVYHGGFVRGYRTEIFIWPEEDFGMVLLTNGVNDFSHMAVPDIIDKYMKEKASP